jgi:hypothetical protein
MTKGDTREHKIRLLQSELDKLEKELKRLELELFRMYPKLDAHGVDARKRVIDEQRAALKKLAGRLGRFNRTKKIDPQVKMFA